MLGTTSICQKLLQFIYNVAEGLLAASLTSFLLVFSSVLERFCSGFVIDVLYFLSLLITVCTVFHCILVLAL